MVDYESFARAQQPSLVSTILLSSDQRRYRHLCQLSKGSRAQANLAQDNNGYQATYQQQTQNFDVGIQLLCLIPARMQGFQKRRSITRRSCDGHSAIQTPGHSS
jgi:hypothetical protein